MCLNNLALRTRTEAAPTRRNHVPPRPRRLRDPRSRAPLVAASLNKPGPPALRAAKDRSGGAPVSYAPWASMKEFRGGNTHRWIGAPQPGGTEPGKRGRKTVEAYFEGPSPSRTVSRSRPSSVPVPWKTRRPLRESGRNEEGSPWRNGRRPYGGCTGDEEKPNGGGTVPLRELRPAAACENGPSVPRSSSTRIAEICPPSRRSGGWDP